MEIIYLDKERTRKDSTLSLVKIEWSLDDDFGYPCCSVGYIIEEKEDFIRIAPHISDYLNADNDNIEFYGAMIIPKAHINKITKIIEVSNDN